MKSYADKIGSLFLEYIDESSLMRPVKMKSHILTKAAFDQNAIIYCEIILI